MQLHRFCKQAAAAWHAPLLLLIVAAMAAGASGTGLEPLPAPGPILDLDSLEASPEADAVDEDSWFPQGAGSWPSSRPTPSAGLPWVWQWVPDGLVWRSYLAGVKEPRFSLISSNNSRFGTIWDANIGGRVAILRYGTPNAYRPEGWELQFEGVALPRIWPNKPSAPLISCDYRVGIPLVYANGPWQLKLGYCHISAHLGDEYMNLYPDVKRINYMRDSWMLGVGYYYNENWRLYAEADYAFGADGGAKPWEFQFGTDWSPAVRGGAPFFAVYGDLRQELNFGGYFVVQAGWQWRGGPSMHTFRIGVQYVNGASTQYEFYNQFAQQTGFGVWYDF